MSVTLRDLRTTLQARELLSSLKIPDTFFVISGKTHSTFD